MASRGLHCQEDSQALVVISEEDRGSRCIVPLNCRGPKVGSTKARWSERVDATEGKGLLEISKNSEEVS